MEVNVHVIGQLLAAHPLSLALGMFAVAFGESLMIVSFIFPGTAILLVAGTLVSVADLPAAPVLIGAILGAMAGEGVS